MIESTVGAVRSIVQVYSVAGEIPPEPTARTWKVWSPPASSVGAVFVAGFVVPQSVNDDPSSEHWNFSIASVSLKVNDGVRLFDTSDGDAVIAGAAGVLCLANPKPKPGIDGEPEKSKQHQRQHAPAVPRSLCPTWPPCCSCAPLARSLDNE